MSAYQSIKVMIVEYISSNSPIVKIVKVLGWIVGITYDERSNRSIVIPSIVEMMPEPADFVFSSEVGTGEEVL